MYIFSRNVRLYYPYWQYTDLFIFRFVFLLSLRSTLRLLKLICDLCVVNLPYAVALKRAKVTKADI